MKGQGFLRKMKRWRAHLRHDHADIDDHGHHATPSQVAIHNQNKSEIKPVKFPQLFRYTSRKDKCRLVFALLMCALTATGFPIMNFLAAQISAVMVSMSRGKLECHNGTIITNKNATNYTEYKRNLTFYTILMAAIGVMQIFTGYLAIAIFNRVAKRQTYQIRIHYFQALLRQNIGWYDTRRDKSFISHMEEDVRKIEQSIGDKLALFCYYGLNSFFCLGIAIYCGWKLTLSIIVPFPVMATLVFLLESCQSKLTVQEHKMYGKTGNIAQQVIVNIKTVFAFNGQAKEIRRYSNCLDEASLIAKRRSFATSIGVSLAWFFNFVSYALVIWYGTKLIIGDWNHVCEGGRVAYDVDAVIAIIFNVLDVEFNLAQCVILMEILSQGRGAGAGIFSVIDRKSEIDSSSKEGIKGESKLAGSIEFINVHFAYPMRPNVTVLDGFTLRIEAGMTVAIVGESGCGKSTCIYLLQRFYDPSSGRIVVDGIDLKEYNLKWYRSQVAIVSQEPTLFNTTISENIRYGRMDATQEDIENACILANAHHFIEALPQKYDTVVGNRGSQLSGGQKQRIAIARAFVQNPAILLLDEITSALDYKNEYLIQCSLDEIRKGRTTIIITHNLRTVTAADLIVIVKNGKVTEMGTPKSMQHKYEVYTDEEEINVQDLQRYSGVDNIVAPKQEEQGPHEAQSNVSHAVTEEISEVNTLRLAMLHTPAPTPPLEYKRKLDYRNKIRHLATTKSILRIFWMNKRDWPMMLIAVLMSVVHGFVLPATAYFFEEGYHLFSNSNHDKHFEEAQEKSNDLVLKILYLGAVSTVAIFFGLLCFSLTGDRSTNRLRKRVFEAMMRQELGWFQKPENNVGALCSRLSEDAAIIHEATGCQMETFIQTMTTIAISIGLSFYLQANLAAVTMVFVPIILLSSFFNGKMVENQESEEKLAHEQASNTGYQAVSNIRTVASLHLEEFFLEYFTTQLKSSYKKSLRQSHILGIVFGISQGVMCFAYSSLLYYGGYLVGKGDTHVKFEVVFTLGELLIWTMLETGQTLAYLPSYNRAKVAAGRMFLIFNRKSQMEDFGGIQLDSCNGDLRFEDVNFHYPNRPSYKVLEDLSFETERNKCLAIIGPSGSGKSTVIELILRLFDPCSGAVSVDDTDIRHLHLEFIRSQVAVVNQEPGLFDYTIAENIAYGDNTRAVSQDEIESACRSARIHDFIESLPEGYDTQVGDRGVQLSGGQKQRLAIARALIRNPRILLLDEATSALDRENEQIVQEALSFAESDRTCVKIAHHLYHIKDAHRILVVNGGRLVEQGTHEELLRNRGIYFKLWTIQEGYNK